MRRDDAVCDSGFAHMAVNADNYDHPGHGNYGIALFLPQVVADDHLVYFDYNRNRGSWVIRDFIAQRRLDDNHSALTVAQIEADVMFNEFPIGCT